VSITGRLFVIDIFVKDLDEILKVYTNNPIGLDVAEIFEDDEWKIRVARVPVGDTFLTFVQPLDPNSPAGKRLESRGEGIDHITLLVDDMSEVMRKLKESGLRIVDPVTRNMPIKTAVHAIEGARVIGLEERVTKIPCNLISFECPKCLGKLNPGINFCPNCGDKISKKKIRKTGLEAKMCVRNAFEIKEKTYSSIHPRTRIKDIFGEGLPISERVSKNLSFAVQIIKPKGKTKPHVHKSKEQIYFIHNGRGTMSVGEDKTEVREGDVIYVPAGLVHSFYNYADKPCTVILVSDFHGSHD